MGKMPLDDMVLFCCVVAHSRNTVRIIHPVPLPVIWGRTWNNLRWRSVYCNPSRSLPLLPLFFSCRKHALNCHRMKPALFSVLCEIKEKTGEFSFQTSLVLFVFHSLLRLEPCAGVWCASSPIFLG